MTVKEMLFLSTVLVEAIVVRIMATRINPYPTRGAQQQPRLRVHFGHGLRRLTQRERVGSHV